MYKKLTFSKCKHKLKSLYKKQVLANFLNWFAMRSLNLYSKFASRLILQAWTLDPSREVFRKNLTDLNLKNTRINVKKKRFQLCTIDEIYQQATEEIIFFDTPKTVTLSKPKVFNTHFTVTDNYICTAILPDTYLAKIKNALLFAGTDLIVVGHLAIYDEMKKDELKQFAIKSPVISTIHKDEVTVNMPKVTRQIKTGIHLTKDHSMNYFHWLVECLPKLSLISDLSADIPLLVDDFLPQQFYDALDYLNTQKREIIRIGRDHSYKVKELYYPSRLSIIHDNYGTPVYDKDVIYSAEGIHFVRESILTATNNSGLEPSRKIFISRKNSSYRQLLNSVEVENLLVSRGFEIVFPENLSFLSQIRIFSQAKMIIGQSGAGMTNFIFAPKTAKILMMLSDAPGSNLQLFNALAEAVGIKLEYIMGKTATVLKKYGPHSDFHVDIDLLAAYLDKEML